MALSPATGLANYSAGISSSVLTVDSNSDRVGIGTTNPQDTLQVGTAITMGSGTVTATQGNFQNVSIAGTLTYEDTTSVDSVGIITARSGISITGGGLSVVGDTDLVGNLIGVNATGISTIVNLTSTNVSVTGVTTISNTIVGGATTQLVVNGNARITGILTMGTSTITLDGTQDKIISGKYDFLGISTSHNDTAVDVFVYDTTKDSDGGEWRKRTQHTSWYNETLNTATRGSRKEFPAVAVIVAESNNVKIYDGDDPDLPMWMVFEGNSSDMFTNGGINYAVTALNGILSLGDSGAIWNAHFISDRGDLRNSTRRYDYNGNIEQRNDGLSYTDQETSGALVNSKANDVAMTVLPNAPIDDATGLPIPTIAVATDNGVSVIKDDGSVVDGFTATTIKTGFIGIDRKSNKILYAADNTTKYKWIYYFDIPSTDNTGNSYLISPNSIISDYNHNADFASYSAIPLDNVDDGQVDAVSFEPNKISVGTDNKLAIVHFDEDGKYDTQKGLMCGITTNYNTGWQNWDIKGAFLSSNVATAVTFTNLATDGDFGQSSDLTSWTAYNATLTHQTDAIRVADNGDFSKAYQSFTTVDGRRYIATVNCKTLSGSDAVFSIGSASPAQLSWNNNGTVQQSTTGLKSLVFTASGTTNYVELGSTGGGFAEYNNVRIDEVKEEDRSVNNNPLEVYGTITKSAVAGSGDTAADLVAYSGFSASNYLHQPYNSSLGINSTDSLTIICWTKASNSDSGLEIIFGTGELSTGRGRYLYLSNGIPYLDTYGGASQQATQAIDDGNWHHLVGIYTPNGGFVYVDGRLVSTPVFHVGYFDQTGTSWSSRIGTSLTNSDPFDNGSIALLRVSNSVPSAEQIKKIYEDEKVLFQENSQATLYGSSDAVTALAYDEITDQLHVGTSSGRSDFQGLRRINNTTVGITSAISAHDSFIIEQ